MADNYFTLFNLPCSFVQDATQIKANYYALQQAAHPDKFVDAPMHQQSSVYHSAMINDAYKILKDPFKRALYILKLQGIDLLAQTQTALPQDLLMEQMELRETLAQIQSVPTQLEQFKMKIQATLAAMEQQVNDWINPPELSHIKHTLWQIQFYRKLQEELN